MAQDKKNRKKVNVVDVLQGSVLLNEGVLKRLPLVALLTLMGLVMISNRFKGEKVLRRIEILQDSVQDLRSESAAVEADLMNMSRYSFVLNECKRRGLDLDKPKEPPVKIVVSK